MNTCESYAALLDAFAEGDLFTEDMLQVQKHLDNCPACQAYLDDLFAIRAAFPTIEDTEVPEGFAENVMAAVAAHPRAAAPAAPVSRKKKNPWAKALLPLAACCAIVVLLQSGPFGGSKKESAYDVSYRSAVTREEPAKTEAPAARADEPAAAMVEEGVIAETENTPAAGPTYFEDAKSHSLVTADAATQNERIAFPPVYQHVMYLPAEAAVLLEDFTPTEETEDTICYQVDMADYTIIQSRLADAGISYMEEEGIEPDVDLVLIILKK